MGDTLLDTDGVNDAITVMNMSLAELKQSSNRRHWADMWIAAAQAKHTPLKRNGCDRSPSKLPQNDHPRRRRHLPRRRSLSFHTSGLRCRFGPCAACSCCRGRRSAGSACAACSCYDGRVQSAVCRRACRGGAFGAAECDASGGGLAAACSACSAGGAGRATVIAGRANGSTGCASLAGDAATAYGRAGRAGGAAGARQQATQAAQVAQALAAQAAQAQRRQCRYASSAMPRRAFMWPIRRDGLAFRVLAQFGAVEILASRVAPPDDWTYWEALSPCLHPAVAAVASCPGGEGRAA